MGIAERKEREKQLRKDEIISAAEKVFSLRGPDNATIDEIAEKAEISKGTIYLYFKSKEQLHREVAMRTFEKLFELASHLNEKGKNALEKLVELGNIFIDYIRKNPGYLMVLNFSGSPDYDNLDISKEELKEAVYRDSPIRMVLEFVTEGVEQNLIRSDINPLIIANTLWSQLLGVLQLAFLNKGLLDVVGLEPDVLFKNHLELVLNGIRK